MLNALFFPPFKEFGTVDPVNSVDFVGWDCPAFKKLIDQRLAIPRELDNLTGEEIRVLGEFVHDLGNISARLFLIPSYS